MTTEPPHRKSIQHHNILGHVHLLTFSCYKRMPLLNNDVARHLLSESINRASERLGFGLVAFVYMPEHVHLMVFPKSDDCTIEKILYGIKKPYSSRMKKILTESNGRLLQSLTVQERPGKISFRFWQEGPGYDRNYTSLDTCIQAAEYVHNNPVRRGLCKSPDEYRWSSWKFFFKPDAYDVSVLPKMAGFPS